MLVACKGGLSRLNHTFIHKTTTAARIPPHKLIYQWVLSVPSVAVAVAGHVPPGQTETALGTAGCIIYQ